MIASPVSSSPRARPSSATSSARTASPTAFVRRDISTRLTPARTANSAEARPSISQLVRVSEPSGLRSSSTCAATMPSSARQRATSRPTSLAVPMVRGGWVRTRPSGRRRRCGSPRPWPAAASLSAAWNSTMRWRSASSDAARMRTASSPALRALPTATVATGTPAGICTIDRSESSPSRCSRGTGTPITGNGVTAASIPGRWAAPPAPAMITRSPRPAASLP